MKRELLRSASYSLTGRYLVCGRCRKHELANPADPVNPLKKRFLIGKGLDICDQGAFFVGGVPKVTNFASSSTAGDPQQVTLASHMFSSRSPTSAASGR
jgi:hypothetical protein